MDNNGVRQRKNAKKDTQVTVDTGTTEKAPFQTRSISRTPELIVFLILVSQHFLAASRQPIQDCDEVFNYWEPTHYLNHGHGFQTWEYSPVYAIRSWAYAGLHSLVAFITSPFVLVTGSKATEFFFTRRFFAVICANCETYLYSKIADTVHEGVAMAFFLIMTFSSGMYHASVAYLPSTFAMYAVMLGIAAFMDEREGKRTAQGIFAIGVGAIFGWPFVAAMVLPFLIGEASNTVMGDRRQLTTLIIRVAYGAASSLLVLALLVTIDSLFYQKLVVVPLNIVWYNVFSGRGGPDLYGTEPWHFYLRNLFLNFNMWFILALLSLPILLMQNALGAQSGMNVKFTRILTFLSPFYLWLGIFTLQPHKEERFMYPAYPALALNAAIAARIIYITFSSKFPKDKNGNSSAWPQLVATILLAAVYAPSVSRAIGTFNAFGAPLSVYQPLFNEDVVLTANVCLGKEWYRFPSHFFLPEHTRAKFIKSEFSGLLPGEFHEALGSGLASRPGTWLEPSGMNDLNLEDKSKYIDVKRCDYLVDLWLPSTIPTKLEPDYAAEKATWERLNCLPYMDSASMNLLARTLWIPDLSFVPARFRPVWGEYCLLKRRKNQVTVNMDPVPHIETLG